MTINGIKYHKFYVRIDQVFLFESLMIENEIKSINEKELHTNVSSNIFYIKESDIEIVDKLCLDNNIDLGDDYSSVLDERYYDYLIPKFIKPFAGIIALIIVILFLLDLANII